MRSKLLILIVSTQLAVPKHTYSAQAPVAVFEFDTPANLEGWTAVQHTTNLSQIAASTGEGVIRFQQTDIDPRLNNPLSAFSSGDSAGTIGPPPGNGWDTIQFRLRHLDRDGVSPIAFNSAGTLLYITTATGVSNLTSGPFDAANGFTRTAESEGWSTFLYDFASVLERNKIPTDQSITSIRIDPIGGTANTNRFCEIDYIRIYARPDAATTYQYDAVGRIASATYSTGQSVFYGYDAASNLQYTYAVHTGPDADGDGLADNWEIHYFGNTGISGPSTDSDGDGRSDILERAIGSDPSRRNTPPNPLLFSIERRAGDARECLYLTFTRQKHLTDIGVEVQVSNDLLAWRSATSETQIVGEPLDNADGTETITLRCTNAISDEKRFFVRLSIE